MVAGTDIEAAYRAAVSSWFLLDLANARLTQELLAGAAEARPELGLTGTIIDVTLLLKQAGNLGALVQTMP